jgi:transposase InsO family protein
MGWWSVFGKPKARKVSKPATPAHDDLVRRRFRADAPNEVWVADLTYHRRRRQTALGRLTPIEYEMINTPPATPGRLTQPVTSTRGSPVLDIAGSALRGVG